MPGAFSEAERDPHAFLHWPPTRLLVVPLGGRSAAGALALRVDDRTLTELGTLRHPETAGSPYGDRVIRRSLVVDGVLWTVSGAGLLASDPTTVRTVGWVPLD